MRDEIDWAQLQTLRQAFLQAQGFLPDYWHNEALLHAYELTLAQRIAWKWQAVLEVLQNFCGDAGLSFPRLLDWGCGTGVATRTVLASGIVRGDRVSFMDRSTRAMQYAGRLLKEKLPAQVQTPWNEAIEQPYALLVSHVLSELPAAARQDLLALCRKAKLLVWVEAGRPQESRILSQLRDELRRSHTILAPCPHQNGCGMLQAGQEHNWCHFFAPVPSFVFQSAAWRSYSQQLGIDLRSLPVSYFIAADPSLELTHKDEQGSAVRILGRSRSYKAYCRWTGCHAQGIVEADYAKRRSRQVYKALQEPGLQMTIGWADIMPEPAADKLF